MKKLPLLILILAAGLVLALLAGLSSLEPAMAIEPTPTPMTTSAPGPGDQTTDISCHLSSAADCDFIDPMSRRPMDVTSPDSPYKLYPPPGAGGVPTSTLVSVVFDRSMDISTINTGTFYLSQGNSRVGGAVEVLPLSLPSVPHLQGHGGMKGESQIAIFYPAAPLLPEAVYTATLTRGVRDVSGVPLVQPLVWSFTTSSGVSALSEALRTRGAPLPGGMNIYFGDLHGHSFLSDGYGTPAQAFAVARAVGLDFFALTDHCFMLTPDEWQTMINEANAATNPFFVGLHGFEYTHRKGHINVFNSNTYVHRDDPNYDTLEEFYAWLLNQPSAIGQFNHPFKDFNFDNFAYHLDLDHKIILRELSNRPQYFLSLNAGWHLGSVGNSDAHSGNWGQRRMGVVAPVLTRQTILDALKDSRTFFASPNDLNFGVVMQANGYWMGSAIPNVGQANFVIHAYDPDPTGRPLRLRLYKNGVLVASTSLSSRKLYTWTPSIQTVLGHYYYVEVYHDHWLYPAYTSPIWVEQPPIAKIGPAQIAAPGMVVTLKDNGSWDPDGDALVYRWTQQAGPTVGLSNADKATATFVAPNVVGDLAFNLTVVDPGGLSDVETAWVTVTDKPILSITKTGPATAEPGELITYVLTVVNHGINSANSVRVTDVVPVGATYVNGGELSGNTVSWTIPEVAANGGLAQVSFSVTTAGAIVNKDYGASCPDCIPAKGQIAVVTNELKVYLPAIQRNP